ncbi:MAG: 30S ribosomal protein S7 [Methanobacteriota archaeon]|nr:MAG: 30S ribosomal protein S7 [Euryarchaeota archaeon]
MELKVFGRWDTKDVVVHDPGLKRYISLRDVAVPHGGARNANKQFSQAEIHLVERLMNKLMVTGHEGKTHRRTSGRNTGKKMLAYRIVKEAFEIIEKRTKRNPIQVLVEAVSYASPREETTMLKYGGVSYHQSVDVAPKRRLDVALRFIAAGAAKSAFKKKKSLAQALAEEIISASKQDNKCYSISRKEEIERIAKAAR